MRWEVLIEVRPRIPDLEDKGLLRRSGPATGATTAAVESLEARAPEIAQALQVMAEPMRGGLDEAAAVLSQQGWALDVTKSSSALGLSLEAKAGVVISKASAGATLSAKLTPPRPKSGVRRPPTRSFRWPDIFKAL